MGDGEEESLLPTSVGKGQGLGKWRSPVVLLLQPGASIAHTLPSIEAAAAAAINKDGGAEAGKVQGRLEKGPLTVQFSVWDWL